MFGKLFKHEFLATWRLLGTVVGIIFAVSLTLLIPTWLHVPGLGTFGLAMSVVGFCVGGAVVPVLLAINYWRTMYSGVGYFTHSLPVRGREIFAAKATYACLVSLVGLVLGLGLALLLPGSAFAHQGGLSWHDMWAQVTQAVGRGMLGAMIGALLVYYGALYVMYLSAITVGTRGAFGRMGLGGPILAVVIAYFAYEILAAASIVALPISLGITQTGLGPVTFQWMGLGFLTGDAPTRIGIGFLPVSVVLAVVGTVLAVRSIERHTSLN